MTTPGENWVTVDSRPEKCNIPPKVDPLTSPQEGLIGRSRGLPFVASCVVLMIVAGALGGPKAAGQEAKKDILKYKLAVKPGDLQINRMPPTSPKMYKESFTFTVTNPTRTDFIGEAPTAQLHDIVVSRMTGSGREEVWRWSKDKVFAKVITPVKINPGKSWDRKADWEFSAKDVKDGDYIATGIFIPTNGTAEAKFKITSVQQQCDLLVSSGEVLGAELFRQFRIKIDPGKSWQRKTDWEFSTKDVDYVAVANFIPTGSTAEVKFKITSVE